MIKDKSTLKRIVSEFRRGILGLSPSSRMCYAICLPLQSYLSLAGYKTVLIEGDFETDCGITNHSWLQLPDGRIIDPTADQLSRPAP